MNKEEIKIITLGDIFENIETEEKAFRFKDYVKNLQDESERLNNIINNVDKIIDDLYEELENRECGDSYIYDYEGNIVSLDTGYAFEGIEFFIKELKHKLKEGNK